MNTSLVKFGNKPTVMGILNVTPDSFFDGGSYTSIEAYSKRIESMINEGVDMIDIGGYSSRPGAQHISEEEEYNRLFPIISHLTNTYSHTLFSIDTFRSGIVERLHHEFGDFVVNDISGGMMDARMLEVCGKLQLPYICMHMQGTPQTMQYTTQYSNIIQEVYSFFELQIQKAVHYGIKTIIIDPGFGFGKTLEQNYELLSNLQTFTTLEKPILVGMSRKSMIYKALNTSPQEALNGTSVLNTIALQKGASILRVHDVKEAKEVIHLSKLCTTHK